MLTLVLLKDPYQQHMSYFTLDQDFYLQEILFTWVSLPLALLNIMWKMEGLVEMKRH